jgi:hypothetical protein
MGVITSLITERNDKDIKVYTEKIDNFDKELQDLKTNIGKNLVSEDDKNKDEKEQFKFNESTFADGANGCLVRRANGKIDYDPSCLCKKTNTCASVYDTLGKDTLKDNKEANELLSTLDKVYSGDSSYVDDKLKSDNLLNMATKFAQNSVGKLNETLASQGEGTIDLNKAVERSVGALLSDVSNPKGKKLAVGAGPSVAAKASKGSSSRGDSGVPDYFSGLGSAGGASGGNQGGIHLKTEIAEEVDLQDIHPTPEESLFDVISLRYQKSIMQHYIKNSTPER